MRLSSRVKRRLAVVSLCLSLLACTPAPLRAQSGRNRSQPGQPWTRSGSR